MGPDRGRRDWTTAARGRIARKRAVKGVEIDQPGSAVGRVRAIARVAAPTPAEVTEDEDSRRHTVATS